MPRPKAVAHNFPFNPVDYLFDPAVRAMGVLGRGAYGGALLPALWDQPTPGVVVDDDEILANLAMCTPEEWAKVRTRVSRAFDTTSRPGFWIQKRMVEEHAKLALRKQKLTVRAKAGGDARVKKAASARAAAKPEEPSLFVEPQALAPKSAYSQLQAPAKLPLSSKSQRFQQVTKSSLQHASKSAPSQDSDAIKIKDLPTALLNTKPGKTRSLRTHTKQDLAPRYSESGGLIERRSDPAARNRTRKLVTDLAAQMRPRDPRREMTESVWQFVRDGPRAREMMEFAARMWKLGDEADLILALVKETLAKKIPNPFAYWAHSGEAYGCRRNQISGAREERENARLKKLGI